MPRTQAMYDAFKAHESLLFDKSSLLGRLQHLFMPQRLKVLLKRENLKAVFLEQRKKERLKNWRMRQRLISIKGLTQANTVHGDCIKMPVYVQIIRALTVRGRCIINYVSIKRL